MAKDAHLVTIATIDRFLAENNIHFDDFSVAMGIGETAMHEYREGRPMPSFVQRRAIAVMVDLRSEAIASAVEAAGLDVESKKPIPQYDLIAQDKRDYLAMRLFSENLLNALWRDHPTILRSLGAVHA